MLDILKSTAKSTIIYSFGNLSSRLAGFILIPIYTSHLNVSEYGTLGMLEISSQILIAILGLGLYTAFFRWYWDENYKGQQKSLFFTILMTILALSGITLFPVFLAKKHIALFLLDSAQSGNLILLLFVLSSVEAINIVIATLLRIRDKSGLFSILMLSKLLISLSLNIYFIVYRKKSVEGIYYAQIIGGLSYILFSLFFLFKEIEVKFRKNALKEMLRFSSPLLIVAITGIILNITDRYALKFLTNLDEVGKYSLGFKISNTIRVFIITSVNLALQPMIFKMMDASNNKRFYSKIMTYYAFGLMIFVLGISMFGEEIVKVLSKKTTYWDSYRIIPIISFGMFFTMLRDVSLTGINITKKTYLTARITSFCMIFNILLSVLLTYLLHSIGAAIAATISQALFFILVFRAAQKEYYIPYELNKIILLITIAIVFYAISTIFSNFNLIIRLPLKTLLIVLFPIVLLLFKFYEPIELERLGQFWRKWRNISKIIDNFKNLKSN
jgi:O-antigen/teichoic acid export membrane protein